MAASDDCLLLLYVDDGEQWASFIANRLSTSQYNIKSILRNVTYTAPGSTTETTFSNNTQSSRTSQRSIESSSSSRRGLNIAYDGGQMSANVEYRDSGMSSRTTFSEMSCPPEWISSTRANILFLSPDSISTCPFPFDVSLLNHRRSVFLFLGVDIEEVRTFFGDKSDNVFKCRCCVIDSDERSICDAMVQIIEAYEDMVDGSINDEDDDDDVYHIPGCPIQLNNIENVFPRELTEKDREVHILLVRAAEDDVFVVLDGAFSRKILLTCVCERLYKFKLPDNISGQVSFKVECQNHCIGEDSVQVITKLDQLMRILNEEVNPVSVLASALGLAADDLGGVDTALAFKLQQLAPAITFQKMFPCEDALINSIKDERADALYPTLLHFAADLNLRTFCSELLRYPGMLAASLTENSEGEYPSQIAARKGYTLLEFELLQFVENLKPESELYVPPSPMLPSMTIRPKPHQPADKTPHYVNEPRTSSPASGLYIHMGDLNLSKNSLQDKQFQQSETDLVSPISESSESSDNVFLASFRSVDAKSDVDAKEDSFLPLLPGTSLCSPGETSSKALKMLGVQEEEVSRTRALTFDSAQTRSESPACGPFVDAIPYSIQYSGVRQVFSDPPRSTMGTCDDPVFKGMFQQESKQKILNKVVSFFGKIKNKRLTSEGGDNTSLSGRSLKKSISNKSDKSVKDTQETSTLSRKKKSADPDSQERDSGSYSDEEKEKSVSSGSKKNGKTKEFKDRGKPIARRLSQRAQAASKECVRDAPELPSTGSRREIFTNTNEKF